MTVCVGNVSESMVKLTETTKEFRKDAGQRMSCQDKA